MAPAARGDIEDESSARVHRHGRSIVWVETSAGRWAVTDIRDFRQFVLNGTSGMLWRSFDGHTADDDIVTQLLRSFPGHPETAGADCRSLIDELVRLRLLEQADPDPVLEQADDLEKADDAGMEL
jgi:hypothetical protein